MEDRFGKYLRLFGSIFFLVLGFILSVVIILFLIRVFFGLMSYIPMITYVYMIFILLVPPLLFITSYMIYFKRTRLHPKAVVRWISYTVFAAALIAWSIFLVKDAIIFYKHAYNAIGMYHSYNIIFLSVNVAAFFLVGVIQALSSEKETDWMERAGKY